MPTEHISLMPSRGPTQSVYVADPSIVGNVLDLSLALPIAIYQ